MRRCRGGDGARVGRVVAFEITTGRRSGHLWTRRKHNKQRNTRRRAADVFDHPWFRDVRFDWAALRDGTLKPEPLAISADFEKQRARRVARLERSLKADEARISEEEVAEASAVFADF